MTKSDFDQLIASAKENADEKQMRIIESIERRGWMGPDEERKLWAIADGK